MLGERAGGLATHDQRADDPFLAHQRHRQERAESRLLEDVEQTVGRLALQIRDLDRGPSRGGPADHRLAHVDPRLAQRLDQLLADPEVRPGHEELLSLVELVDRAALGLRELDGVG